MRKLGWVAAGVAATVIAAAGVGAATMGSGSASAAAAKPSATSAKAVVNAAATALGGAQKIGAIKNITLLGYGQYAYMMGGGRLTGSVHAPDKFVAANDLRRIYDLEHDRFDQLERRNMLFPFLDVFGHNFTLQDLRLDGDVAYDVVDAKPARRARFMESAQHVDGVHMRRMWQMNNPVVLVRRLEDASTKLAAPRREGQYTVVDAVLKEGDRLSAGFEADGMPAFVRWANPHTNMGQANFTTWWTGFSDVGGGVMLPYGYDTRMDFRQTNYSKLYVDAYRLDTAIPDLAAPAEIRTAPEPVSFPVPKLTHVQAGKGVWRISNGTTVFEFKDHLVLFELGVNARGAAKAVLDYARTLAPGKPITMLVASHNHFDHTAGLREAVSEGITIIQRPNSESQFREAVAHTALEFPDDLAKAPKPLKFRPIKEHLRLQDETQTVDLYWGRENGHMSDVVFAYVPALKLMAEGDLVTAAFMWQNWPDTFRDVMKAYNLEVDTISPVHSVWREHPDLLTRAQGEEILAGGTKRSRERCAEQLAKANYIPGCPIQSKYY